MGYQNGGLAGVVKQNNMKEGRSIKNATLCGFQSLFRDDDRLPRAKCIATQIETQHSDLNYTINVASGTKVNKSS